MGRARQVDRGTAGTVLTVLRAGYGTVQLVRPGLIGGWLIAGGLDSRERAVSRVLGARQLLQAAVTLAAPGSATLTLGAGVDALHATSMLGLGLADRRRRRAAFNDAAVAGALALAGLAAAGSADEKERGGP